MTKTAMSRSRTSLAWALQAQGPAWGPASTGPWAWASLNVTCSAHDHMLFITAMLIFCSMRILWLQVGITESAVLLDSPTTAVMFTVTSDVLS